MALRPPSRRDAANVDYSAVGKSGRRTGVTLDLRPLDVNGIEEITGIFSSPRKPSPLKNVMVMETVEDTSTTPPQLLSARRTSRSTPARPPRSSSPRKSGVSGTARKGNGVDIFSAQKSLGAKDEDDRENTPVPAPIPEAVPTPTPNTPRSQMRSTRTIQRTQPRRFSPTPERAALKNITTITPTRLHRLRPSLEVQQIEDEVAASIEEQDFDPYEEAVQRVKGAAPGTAEMRLASQSAAVPTPTPRNREPSEDLGGSEIGFDDEDCDDEIGDPGELDFEPAHSLPQNEANSRKKRKSDATEQDAEHGTPRPSKVAKKKGRVSVRRDSTPPAPSPKPISSKTRGKQPLRNRDTNPKLSSRRERELEDIVKKVRQRPGPPRSLYILRRETPADDSVTHTRSGRVSVKPLAYWRNERCVFGASPGGANLADGARFPLNSIKEIVRTDDVVDELCGKKSKGKKKGNKQKGKGKARQTLVEDEDSSDSDLDLDEVPEDPEAEAWETGTGTLRGNVAIWDNQDQIPTEQEEEVEVAHAPAAIKTREVKGSSLDDGPTFRYAKLLSTKFFGTGLVDLPPGGIKRPKNSRKMHMSFFVVKGRVTVTVGPLGGEETGRLNLFSIGKGGFWQVPRGNQYSIENEREKPARIFFSQGCEPESADID